MPPNGRLQLEKLFFWYRTSDPAVVFDCSLDVAPGQFVAIVGESGSGKTTLLRLACGLVQADLADSPELGYRIAGRVIYDGTEVERQYDHFSYVPQNCQAAMISGQSAKESVLLAAKQIDPRQAEKYATFLLATTGIYEASHLPVERLSGGQQQRVAICRALVSRPSFLFMDEPFANLDATLKPSMTELLQKLRCEGSLSSLIIVTHDIEHATHLADGILAVRASYGVPKYKPWSPPFFRAAIEAYIGGSRDVFAATG